MKETEAELTEQARRLYEETSIPVSEIAALMRLGRRGFYKKIRTLGWRLRRDRAAEEPVAVSEPAIADTAPAIVVDRAGLIARIRETVDQEISEIDKSLRKLDRLTGGSGLERSAKTLATLVKTLTELKKLDETERAATAGKDDGRPDMEEFRLKIARRLEALCGAGEV